MYAGTAQCLPAEGARAMQYGPVVLHGGERRGEGGREGGPSVIVPRDADLSFPSAASYEALAATWLLRLSLDLPPRPPDMGIIRPRNKTQLPASRGHRTKMMVVEDSSGLLFYFSIFAFILRRGDLSRFGLSTYRVKLGCGGVGGYSGMVDR